MWLAFLAFIKPIGAFLKAIPWKLWAILAAFVLLVLAFKIYGDQKYKAGQAERQGLWDAAVTAQAEADRKFQDVQSSISVASQVRTVEKLKVIHEQGKTITKLVPVYVPAIDLPGGLRLLHDAAASGQVPDPSRGTDAAPVPAQVFATTVYDNYAGCRANAEQVTQWQEWATEQGKASELAGSSGGSR